MSWMCFQFFFCFRYGLICPLWVLEHLSVNQGDGIAAGSFVWDTPLLSQLSSCWECWKTTNYTSQASCRQSWGCNLTLTTMQFGVHKHTLKLEVKWRSSLLLPPWEKHGCRNTWDGCRNTWEWDRWCQGSFSTVLGWRRLDAAHSFLL